MKTRHYAWILVGLLWMVALLNYLDRQVIYSVFPLLSSDLKLSNTELGLLSTAFLWVYGLLSPFAGYLADRFGRVRAILVSLCVWSLVTWATGHCRNFTELAVTRGLMGISEAFYLPAALALIADYHGERTRSFATGLHQSGLYVGIVLGGFGGGWLGEHYGWRPAFRILGVAGVIYLAILSVSLRKNSGSNGWVPVRPPGLIPALRKLARLPGFGTMTLVFGTVSIANWLVYTWLPSYLYEHFRMSLAGAGFSATFYIQAASFVGILLGGWLADYWSRSTARGRLFTQIAGLLISGPFLFLLGGISSQALLVLALVLFGLGRGFYDCNTMPVLCQIASAEYRSTGYGIFNCAGCVIGGAAAALAGTVKATLGLGSAFQIAAVILCLSGLLLFRIRITTSDVEEPAGANVR